MKSMTLISWTVWSALIANRRLAMAKLRRAMKSAKADAAKSNTSRKENAPCRLNHVLRRLQDRRQRQLPLPVRNERGEGRGEGHPTADAQASHRKNDPPLPSPLLPWREERENSSALSSVSALETLLRMPYTVDLLAAPIMVWPPCARESQVFQLPVAPQAHPAQSAGPSAPVGGGASPCRPCRRGSQTTPRRMAQTSATNQSPPRARH